MHVIIKEKLHVRVEMLLQSRQRCGIELFAVAKGRASSTIRHRYEATRSIWQDDDDEEREGGR